MIARAESGQSRDDMVEFDAAEIVRGVAEHDPLADEKGPDAARRRRAAVPMCGNRGLVTQALASLVDNAIKYGSRGTPSAVGEPPEVAVRVSGGDVRLAWRIAVPASPRSRMRSTLRPSRTEPFRAGLRSGAEPRVSGGASARRRMKLEDNAPGLKASLCCRAASQLPQPAE
jgi:signal transduction histidine kinase